MSLNEAAVNNGAELVKKKKFTNLAADKDKTFLSGECLGSGSHPYFCSADFVDEASPAFRCTCPSRQIPCKHVVGLLWAYMEGRPFAAAEIPDDILAKRENRGKRAKPASESPAKEKEKSPAWVKAATKKIEAQLAGLEEAEKVLFGIASSGFGSVDAKTYLGIVRQLDSYFIPGVQNEINDLLGSLADHRAAAEKLCRIFVLVEKGREYLKNKRSAPDRPDTQSEMEELLGYAWKLEELMFQTDAKLLQLCFHVRLEEEKKQYVDEGFYIGLNCGVVYKTRNYRPFKAAKHLKEEDSVFSVLLVPRLYIYPSLSQNPRVRWDEALFEAVTPEACRLSVAFARRDFSEVIKSVKNQLKNLLLFPHPAVLLKCEKLAKTGEGEYIAYDASDVGIALKKSGYFCVSFAFLLDGYALPGGAKEFALLAVFDNDLKSGELFAQPVALVTEEKILRLVY